jgi:hypothetical protein
MTSFLGHLPNVTQLINEFGVYPDVSDSLGNSAVMYATVSGIKYDCITEANDAYFININVLVRRSNRDHTFSIGSRS